MNNRIAEYLTTMTTDDHHLHHCPIPLRRCHHLHLHLRWDQRALHSRLRCNSNCGCSTMVIITIMKSCNGIISSDMVGTNVKKGFHETAFSISKPRFLFRNRVRCTTTTTERDLDLCCCCIYHGCDKALSSNS
jgi:hypothetical protein